MDSEIDIRLRIHCRWVSIVHGSWPMGSRGYECMSSCQLSSVSGLLLRSFEYTPRAKELGLCLSAGLDGLHSPLTSSDGVIVASGI